MITDPTTAATTAGAFADVIGQDEALAVLRAAVAATHEDPDVPAAAMTHAWLFTGPPGSGRSVAARAFAAALQCPYRGCGECVHCRTVLHGTHGDVRTIAPEGLSIVVKEMREVVRLASSRPTSGRWQIVLIEDADRLTEGASNALLKSLEEPPPHTVFLLCAPSTHPDDVLVTVRSRCRVVALRTPPVAAIADVLIRRDGIDPHTAQWAASVAGGHVGRAKRLATDPEARANRETTLQIPGALRSLGEVFAGADELVDRAKNSAKAASLDRDSVELDELRTALGAGGTGKGAALATRGSAGALKELEKRQKTRATRHERDVLDRALVDLSGFYRDVLARAMGAHVPLTNPDQLAEIDTAVSRFGDVGALRRLDAVLACREAIELNVKPLIAVEAMMSILYAG